MNIIMNILFSYSDFTVKIIGGKIFCFRLKQTLKVCYNIFNDTQNVRCVI